jgi:nitrogen fixation NifU-like protein
MKTCSLYTKKVMAHFKNPHNMGRIAKPDGTGRVGNPKCGDVMHLYIKIQQNKQGRKIIKDIKFETFGCAAAIATSSIITDLVKGKALEKAMAITKEDVIKGLGGLPPIKIHCSLLAVDALHEAIYNYFAKNKLPVPDMLAKAHERITKQTEVAEHVRGEH